MQRLLSVRALLVPCAIVALSASAFAGTIDNTPSDDYFNLSGAGSGGYLGGTFVADDIVLESFMLDMYNWSGVGSVTVVALVFATNGSGVPTGSALWTSSTVGLTNSATEYTFSPDIALTPAQRYWIGATTDSNRDAGAGQSGGGSIGVGWTNDNVIAGLNTDFYWIEATGGALPTTVAITLDVTTQIVTNPEPSTLALYGLGILGIAAAVRRRRKATAATAS